MTCHNTIQGDRIDLIVFNHYGSLDMLPIVLAENIFLAKLDSMMLESGLKIKLPDAQHVETIDKVVDEDGLLW